MKYSASYKWWIVTNPRPESEIGDICFEATIGDLALMVQGGLDVTDCAFYTDEVKAKSEAISRINRLWGGLQRAAENSR